MLIHNNSKNKIITDWYHKETWSGRYMNFSSNLPLSYKRNTISILTEKIIKLSHKKFHSKNFKLLRKTLKDNGYPLKIINQQIESTINKLKNPITAPTSLSNTIETTNKKTISIPFIPGLFYNIRRKMAQYNVRVIGKPNNTLQKQVFSKLKDKTPIGQQSSVCYEVHCHDCAGVYIGETRQYLKKRIQQHEYHSKKLNAAHSGLSQHVVDTNHRINWNDYKIRSRENNTFKRKLKEAIIIKKTPDNFNRQLDSYNIESVYNTFIYNQNLQ